MRVIKILIASLTVSACASIDITPPNKSDYAISQTYSLSFEDTWAHAVDWFAGQNVSIDVLEKPSGLITAKYHINDADNTVDCGQISVSGTFHKGALVKNGVLNVTVRALTKERTKVNIYFFSDYSFKVQEIWNERFITSSGECLSTGKLERSILEYIAD